MKALKIILYVLLALVVIGGVLTFVAPTTCTVERAVVINAPKEVVFKNIKYFSNSEKWSPWKDYDPNMKVTLEGTDGEVGAISRWEGNKDVGKGSQEITRIEDMKRVEEKLRFIEPFESEADVYLQMDDDSSGAVKVTWSFTSESPRPFNIFGLFVDMDKMMGDDFEKGLNRLKTLSEEDAKNIPEMATVSYSINEIEFPGKTYVGKKETVGWDKIGEFYQTSLPEVFKALGTAHIAMDGAPCGLYFVWDEANQKTEMAAAIPVKELKKDIKGISKFEVASGKALQVAYYGAYEKIGDAHNAIDAYIKEKGYAQHGTVIEEYVTDPSNEKDTSKWLTNIYYLMQ